MTAAPSRASRPRTRPAQGAWTTHSIFIDSLTNTWDPKGYKDTYREDVLELIGRKAKGEEIVVEETAEEPAKVTDLLAALEASLERAKKGGAPAKKRAGTRKTAAARKATAKRTTSRKTSTRSRKTA